MIIAFDTGFGNIKVCADGATAVLQTAVSRPRSQGLATIGMKSSRRLARQVTVGDAVFCAGPGAWLMGEPIESLDFGSLSSPARRALFYATLADLLPSGAHTADLVVGLPVKLLQNEAQARTVLAELRGMYKIEHTWRVNRKEYQLCIERLTILAQPVGAYADWALDDELRVRKGSSAAQVAVLDLGMNTLDLYVLQNGRVLDRYVDGPQIGVHRLLETLNGHGLDKVEIDAALRDGSLKPAAADLSAWLGEVLGHLKATWPDLQRFHPLIPCGGGALVLGQALRQALEDRGAEVFLPPDPIGANARGLWKWTAYHAARK